MRYLSLRKLFVHFERIWGLDIQDYIFSKCFLLIGRWIERNTRTNHVSNEFDPLMKCEMVYGAIFKVWARDVNY